VADLAFLGTPEAAVPTLRALVAAGHQVRLVVTQPDRRRGRGAAVVPSPVKRAATELGLAVTDDLAAVAECGAEAGIVVAYGRIVPGSLLRRVPMLNVHFSLLPRWRGAAPVERAILAGDDRTGVSLMWLDDGLDTGPVVATEAVAISPEETAAELTARLAEVGARLLVDRLADAIAGVGPGVPQSGEATYATKLTPEELCLDWHEPAAAVVRRCRLGRVHTSFRGDRLLVLGAGLDDQGAAEALDPGTLVPVARVVAGDGSVVALRRVQPAGGRPMDAAAWWHGARPQPGERLGQ
jgi:methionyl-tRNA formyltransferase